MSIYPSPDKLDERNKYELVILAAKRARQIKDGARVLIETHSSNPLSRALEELAEGAIIPKMGEDISLHKAALRPTEPTLEDIISAGPIVDIHGDADFADMDLDGLPIDDFLSNLDDDSSDDDSEDLLASDDDENISGDADDE